MDNQRIQGGLRKATGTVKEKIGQMTGDRQTEAEGKAEKAEGRVRSLAPPGSVGASVVMTAQRAAARGTCPRDCFPREATRGHCDRVARTYLPASSHACRHSRCTRRTAHACWCAFISSIVISRPSYVPLA